MTHSPIALFVYNRLDHLKHTIDALRSNTLATESDLHIFSDGPKKNTDIEAVENVRLYIKSLNKGFKTITLHLSEKNKGLADSIVSGINKLIDINETIIVLEDDIVTSPLFLSYMNDSLQKYKDQEKVMHISGYSFPLQAQLPPVFFSQMPFVWGWATWKRSWNKYQSDAKTLLTEVQKKGKDAFNYDGVFKFTSPLKYNAKGTMKTWAIKWQASIFLNDGLCLTPFPSFSNNIGHDNSGEHSTQTDVYHNKNLSLVIPKTITDISESKEAREAIKKFLKKIKPPLYKLIFMKIKNI